MDLRVIRSGPCHPTFNMGLDEALLLGDGPPTLRLYRWRPFGLSLGYFQKSSDFAAIAGDHVLLRRLTGGGAILHGDEITFSLTLPSSLLPPVVADSYDLLHAGVQRALAAVGIETSAPTDQPHHGTARPEHPWCFADPTPQDLVTPSGKKVLGSAQRRIRRPTERVLHHGSLVLTAPAATPFCGSVAEFDDPRSLEHTLESALIENLAAALQLPPKEGDVRPEERDAAESIATARYASPAFTHRR